MKKLVVMLVWYLMVQSSEPYPEPLYYKVEFNDGVDHYWSREVYWDIYGEVERIDNLFAEKYNNLSHKEIIYLTSKQIMEENNKRLDFKRDSILASIK